MYKLDKPNTKGTEEAERCQDSAWLNTEKTGEWTVAGSEGAILAMHTNSSDKIRLLKRQNSNRIEIRQRAEVGQLKTTKEGEH